MNCCSTFCRKKPRKSFKATGTAKARNFDLVTVMFTDFKNFTQASERLSPEELVWRSPIATANSIASFRYGIEKIKTIGDAYVRQGLPVPRYASGRRDQGRSGIGIHRTEQAEADQPGLPYFELRLGIHTGPVVAGIVGIKEIPRMISGRHRQYCFTNGKRCHRQEHHGTTYELVKRSFRLHTPGKVEAKNKG